MDFRLPRERRLQKKREFDAVFDRGARRRGRYVTLVAAPSEGSQSRVGVIASRRVGGAVQRNRAKRLLREAFRLNRHLLPRPMDVILIAAPDAAKSPFQSVEAEVQRLFRGINGSPAPR